LLAALALVPACSEKKLEPEPANKPILYTTNYPLAYFARRIAGEAAEVRFPAPPGVDPAFWEPEAPVIEAYQQADLVLLNGAGYERWVDRATLAASRLVNTSAAFEADYIPLKDVVTHSHGPEGQHTHAGFASTTWLDPRLAQRQAEAIRDALIRLLPERRAALEQNFRSLANELAGLDRDLERLTAARRPLVASHPVYQYLERRYGLDLVSLHWEPDRMPAAGEWRRLERLLNRHRARLMLWEAEPMEEIARRLAGYGVTVVVFDPCANVPREGDYLAVMRANLARLERALAD
jgi:zinc transport system substrate-binding protein